MYSLVVIVDLHIEGLDVLGVVNHDDWLLEVLLNEITLVLAGEVHTPAYGEFKLLAILHCFLKNLDTLSVGQTDEVGLNH